jgi:hypothetical protein
MPEGCCGRASVTFILHTYILRWGRSVGLHLRSEIRGLGMSITAGPAVLRQMRIAMLALAATIAFPSIASAVMFFRYALFVRPSSCLQWGNDEGGKECRRVRAWPSFKET